MITITEFVERTLQTVRRHGMLAGGETVLVAVSGGADSVALLRVLLELRPRLDLALHVVHVHHGLRSEADREAAFVEALAHRWEVPVTVERVTVGDGPGQSPEARARGQRYAALRRWADVVGATRVALGHTADDQAETVLMRLLQGAGPRGLAGIPPVRGRYIRPLIDIRRREVEALLAGAGTEWVDDPSNRDPKFLRNRIRHDLLPFLASAYNPGIKEALRRIGALARTLQAELDQLAQRELDRLAEAEDGGLVLPRGALMALPAGVGEEVLRQALARLGEAGPLRAWVQRALRRPLEPGCPAPRRLGGAWLEVSGDRIRLSRDRAGPLGDVLLPVPGSLEVPGASLRLDAREFDRPDSYRPPTDPWTAAFDRTELAGELHVRSRRAGDRFLPFGAPGPKRLKAFLIDQKVPRWRRDRLPLLVAGGEVAWVIGVRRGGIAPLTALTRRVLEVRATPLGGGIPTE